MLKVKGNKVYDENGLEVRLLGVNRAGLEWDSRDDRIVGCVKQACDDWKCTVVRVPVSQDRWFGFGKEQQKNDITGEKYRQKLDEIVAAVQERGKHMILDLHWNNMNEWGNNDDQHCMPDINSLLFWKDAATRYKNHPTVLFGLYNEPHSVTWEVWKNGGTVTERKKSYLSPGHQKIVTAIRTLGAKNILIVGGLDWGFTLDELCNGYELEEKNGNGIIYDSHIYPWKPLDWDTHVAQAAKKYPILIGEFGHYGDDKKPREGKQNLPSGEWMPRIIDYIDKNQFHFTAWCFHPQCGPDLVKNWENEPTEFSGVFVRDYLLKQK
jgi:aryl-phospho-beta-D-glucosidase BglC (GH1 family)